MSIKYFTVEEAEKTLPLVKTIVKDILNEGNVLRDVCITTGITDVESPILKKYIETINRYFSELEEIGCFFKDTSFMLGLVDFPAIVDGEKVFLCWKYGEEHITHYHSLTEGFTKRKPLVTAI